MIDFGFFREIFQSININKLSNHQPMEFYLEIFTFTTENSIFIVYLWSQLNKIWAKFQKKNNTIPRNIK